MADRQEMKELGKLVGHIRSRALLAVEKGTAVKKRPMRESLNASIHALQSSLEEIERWAK